MTALINTPIEHLVFDMGGVLVDINWHGEVSKLLGRDIPFEKIHALWASSPSTHAFEHGHSNFETFTKDFIAEHKLDISELEFQTRFRNILLDDMPGIETLLDQLKSRFTLSLLSNTNECHWQMINERNTFIRHIHNPFTSLQFGLMKPAPEIYKRLIDELGCLPGEILFFDDGLKNVEAAQALGIHAVQVFGTEDIREALGDFGIETSS